MSNVSIPKAWISEVLGYLGILRDVEKWCAEEGGDPALDHLIEQLRKRAA